MSWIAAAPPAPIGSQTPPGFDPVGLGKAAESGSADGQSGGKALAAPDPRHCRGTLLTLSLATDGVGLILAGVGSRSELAVAAPLHGGDPPQGPFGMCPDVVPPAP